MPISQERKPGWSYREAKNPKTGKWEIVEAFPPDWVDGGDRGFGRGVGSSADWQVAISPNNPNLRDTSYLSAYYLGNKGNGIARNDAMHNKPSSPIAVGLGLFDVADKIIGGGKEGVKGTASRRTLDAVMSALNQIGMSPDWSKDKLVSAKDQEEFKKRFGFTVSGIADYYSGGNRYFSKHPDKGLVLHENTHQFQYDDGTSKQDVEYSKDSKRANNQYHTQNRSEAEARAMEKVLRVLGLIKAIGK